MLEQIPIDTRACKRIGLRCIAVCPRADKMVNSLGIGVAVVDRSEETALKVVEEIKTLCGSGAARCVSTCLGISVFWSLGELKQRIKQD